MIRDEYINILDIVLCLLLFLHSDITKHLASTNLECLQQQTTDKILYFDTSCRIDAERMLVFSVWAGFAGWRLEGAKLLIPHSLLI